MRLLALTALLLVPLAGCLGGGGGDGDPTSSPRPTTTTTGPSPPPDMPLRIPLLVDFSFGDCSGLTVLQSQPLADMQGLLPEPFVAAPFPLLSGQPEDQGVLAFDLYACANFTAAGTVVPDTFYGQLYTFVERPGDLVPEAPETFAQEYVFRVLAGEDVLGLLWAYAGYDTHNGTASVQVLGSPPAPLRLVQAAAGDYAAEASATDNPLMPGSIVTPFARYALRTDGNLLYWTGEYDFPTAFLGTGDVTVPDDDAFAPFRSPLGNLGGVALTYEGGAVRSNDLTLILNGPLTAPA